MEDIEPEVLEELAAKAIERDVEIKEVEPAEPAEQQTVTGDAEGCEAVTEAVTEPVIEPKPVKVKKPRSEKQKAAFEKARLKRAEGIASRKKQKEEDKVKKKELKKAPLVEEQSVPKPVINTPASTPALSHNKDQVIQNHYYYYGVPPPEHDYNKGKKKKKKSKRPPTPSSSESESESEEEYYKDEPPQQEQEQQYYQVPKPTYKFGFA